MKNVIILLLLALFTSCAASKKTKSYQKEVTDSSSHVKTDSGSVSKTDSTAVKKTDSTGIKRVEETNEHTIETVIDSNVYIDSSTTKLYIPDTGDTVNMETPDKKIKAIPLGNGNGFYLEITDKPKTINVKGTRKETFKKTVNTVDSTHLQKSDSSQKKTFDSTYKKQGVDVTVKKKVINGTKKKWSISIPWWVYVIAGLYIIIASYLKCINPFKWLSAYKLIRKKT